MMEKIKVLKPALKNLPPQKIVVLSEGDLGNKKSHDYLFRLCQNVNNAVIRKITSTRNINENKSGIRKAIETINRVIITIINVSKNSFFPKVLPNSSFIFSHDYLERNNLHKASEIHPSPILLKITQRLRTIIAEGKYVEKFRAIDIARNITKNIPINENTIPPMINSRIRFLSTTSNNFFPPTHAYSYMNINFLGGYQ
jgi:hypothetical protein